MAFHPFQTFRKRQKTLLAILTIFVMFIFILSYSGRGGGDPIDRMLSLIGQGKQKDKTEVTKLYGKAVTVSDLDELRQNRRIADIFISRAVASASQPNISSLEPEVSMRLRGMFQMLQFYGIPEIRRQLRTYQLELQKDGKKEAARQVGNINRGLGLDEWRAMHPGELFFGGTLAADSLLDFMLWRQQADRMNITLTDDDVRKMVNQEADGEVLPGGVKDAEKIRSLFQGINREIDTKELFAALRDEFRVRLAQEALLGNSTGARAALGTGLASDQVPAGSTPDQFWEFFKNNRTELKVDFLKLPVSQFTDQVKDRPTEQQLEALFNLYKNDEPNPERSTPGFKVPRKIKVEWVAANPEAPHYREASAKALPLLPVAQPLTLLTTPPTMVAAPGGVAGLCGSLAVATIWNAPQQLEYQTYVAGIKSWWDASSVVAENDNPYATGLRRPDTVAAVVGQAAGVPNSPWAALSISLTLTGSVEARLAEQKAREASMILAGANPFPLAVVAQEAALINVRVPPLSAVRNDINERLRERVALNLAQGVMASFVKDLTAKRFNPKEAAEFVEKNATVERGITAHATMTEARDQNEIADAPALAPLRRASEGLLPMTPSDARKFGAIFFGPNLTFQPEPFGIPTGTTHYSFWLTDTKNPYVPKFEEAKPQVEAAWKFQKARELAKAEAQSIAAAATQKFRDGGGEVPTGFYLTEQAARPGFAKFQVLSIARLVRAKQPPQMVPSLTTQYEPFRFDEAKLASPRPDLVEKLFDALKQPGDATVIWDGPVRNFYVAVLDERKVPSQEEFFEVYKKAPRGFLSDSLWARFQAEREDQYRAALVRQLREEAQARLDKEGHYEIDPDVRRHLRGSGGAGEE